MITDQLGDTILKLQQSGAPPVHSSAESRWVLHNSSVQSLLLNIQHEQLTAGSDVMSEISELSLCLHVQDS